MADEAKKKGGALKWVLLGCGGLVVIAVLVAVVLVILGAVGIVGGGLALGGGLFWLGSSLEDDFQQIASEVEVAEVYQAEPLSEEEEAVADVADVADVAEASGHEADEGAEDEIADEPEEEPEADSSSSGGSMTRPRSESRTTTTRSSGGGSLSRPTSGSQVEVTGSAEVVLTDRSKRYPVPGKVPEGRYTIEATFPGGSALEVGNVRVGSDKVTIACNERMELCRAQ